jgi:hypothetical protein
LDPPEGLAVSGRAFLGYSAPNPGVLLALDAVVAQFSVGCRVAAARTSICTSSPECQDLCEHETKPAPRGRRKETDQVYPGNFASHDSGLSCSTMA